MRRDVEGAVRSRWRGAWVGEGVHGGGSEDGDGGADGALASKVDAAPVGEVDAVEDVVIQKRGFRDVGVDSGSRDGGRKDGVGKGSRVGGSARLAVGGAGGRRGGRWGTLQVQVALHRRGESEAQASEQSLGGGLVAVVRLRLRHVRLGQGPAALTRTARDRGRGAGGRRAAAAGPSGVVFPVGARRRLLVGQRWCGRATRETKRVAWRREGDGRLGLDHVVVRKRDELQATVGAAGRHVPQPLARVGPAPKAAKPGGRHSCTTGIQ